MRLFVPEVGMYSVCVNLVFIRGGMFVFAGSVRCLFGRVWITYLIYYLYTHFILDLVVSVCYTVFRVK